ncbi:MAG: NUDIX hydrolase [Thermomicrobiales bacterium]
MGETPRQTTWMEPETGMMTRTCSQEDTAVGRREPAIDLRVLLFTVSEGKLRLAVVTSTSSARLPRGWPSPGSSFDADAARILRQQLGVQERYLEQLYTLNTSDSTDWTVVIAYMALVSTDEAGEPLTLGSWRNLEHASIDDPADRRVIEYAIVRLRAKLGYTTIAFHLLPALFTLGELQRTYEAVLDQSLDKRNFRRRILGTGVLDETAGKRRDGSHRPAALYQFRPPHDQEQFLTPSWVEGPTR